jgi:tetratricopeptide (TPR) repeat protein
MVNALRKTPILLLSLALGGCAGLGAIPSPPAEPAPSPASAAPQEPAPAPRVSAHPQYSEDIVFAAVAGEIALQRGDFATAYGLLFQSAALTRDARAAERAARVAMHQRQEDKAMQAALLWVEYAPDDLSAHQLVVLLAARGKDEALALEHLREIVRIGSAEGAEEGFLHAMAALSAEKEFDWALRLMRRLADEYPEQGDARYALALTAVMAKRYELAEGDVQLLLQQEPRNVKAAVLLSRIRAARDDKQGAEEVLRGMVERYPKDTELRTTYARFLMENDRKEDAYKQYLELRKLDPNDGDVHFFLGILALQMDRRPDAIGHLRDLYGLGKRKDEAAYYLGWIAEEAGRPEQAREWLHRVGEGDLHVEAQTRLARLEAKEGRLNQAREILQRLRVDSPEDAGELYLVEVELLKKYAGPEVVLDAYAVALGERPDDENLLYSRAMFYVSQDDLVKMEADLRRILEMNPENSDALNGLGYVLADQTDRLHEAYGYIEKALALEPESAAIMDSMGWVLFRLGRAEEALEYLQKAFDKVNDGEIGAHLGEVLWALDRKDEARRIWKKALEENKDNEYLKKTMQRLAP